jgi:hypothetical protein
MTDTNTEKLLVMLEGQQHWVRRQIAESDDLLRQLFSRLAPELAGAEIQRSASKIEIVPRKGTKGCDLDNVLTALDRLPSEIDPAIAACLVLQRIELHEGINPNRARILSQRIEQAIAQSQQGTEAVKITLNRLDAALPVSTVTIGF